MNYGKYSTRIRLTRRNIDRRGTRRLDDVIIVHPDEIVVYIAPLLTAA